jgi:membrane protease YdiL (CAAX protease family)
MVAQVITVVTSCFLLYYVLFGNESMLKYFQNKFGIEQGQLRFVLIFRISGAFIFGLVPILFIIFQNISFSSIGIIVKPSLLTLIIVLIFSVIPLLINYFGAKKSDNLVMYPQIRIKNWNTKLLIISALTWILYLLGYEIMIRGYLFFNCLKEIGLWPAIAVTTSIYALIHLPKGPKETIGAIPLGIVLCLITSYTGTIWAAFWIHCTLALTNEWFSIKYDKEITLN